MTLLPRRDFIFGSAASLSLSLCARAQPQNPGLLYERKSWRVLENDTEFVKHFENAVSVMKSRPKTDPTSWEFQANIHGTNNGNDPHFNACEHENWQFLPWHRMYLYFFERILSDAAGTRINLPYWNYSHPKSRALPAAFRRTDSPLFEVNRSPGRNSGEEFLESDVGESVVTKTLSRVNFAPTRVRRVSFGGGSSSGGALEIAPHNPLHILMGGKMGDPKTAANDPIFWLHHANIDRLWSDWIALGGGRENPTNPKWLNQEYEFFDENGKAVKMAVKEVLETSKLGYVYAKDEEDDILVAKGTPKRDLEMKRTLVGAAPARHVIGATPLTLSLPIKEETLPRVAKAIAAGDVAFEISLNDVRVEQTQKGIIRVFINKPDVTKDTSTNDPHYAGYFAFFGKDSSHGGEGKHRDQVIDITDTIKRLDAQGDFHVTLVATEPTEVTAGGVNLDMIAP